MKRNLRPYRGLAHHLLIIPKKHLVVIGGVTPNMAAELISLWQWAIEKFEIPGGGFFNRFGDPKYHGGSQEHLHFHIMVPDGTVPVEELFNKKR